MPSMPNDNGDRRKITYRFLISPSCGSSLQMTEIYAQIFRIQTFNFNARALSFSSHLQNQNNLICSSRIQWQYEYGHHLVVYFILHELIVISSDLLTENNLDCQEELTSK